MFYHTLLIGDESQFWAKIIKPPPAEITKPLPRADLNKSEVPFSTRRVVASCISSYKLQAATQTNRTPTLQLCVCGSHCCDHCSLPCYEECWSPASRGRPPAPRARPPAPRACPPAHRGYPTAPRAHPPAPGGHPSSPRARAREKPGNNFMLQIYCISCLAFDGHYPIYCLLQDHIIMCWGSEGCFPNIKAIRHHHHRKKSCKVQISYIKETVMHKSLHYRILIEITSRVRRRV